VRFDGQQALYQKIGTIVAQFFVTVLMNALFKADGE
jgi:hypothetical protein